MTGREAVEAIIRESAEAGVAMGPAGQDERFREEQIEWLDAHPGAIPHFLTEARAVIAAGGLAARLAQRAAGG